MKAIKCGLILAAGEGLRMRPLTNYYPKITLPILNKPLLIHHLDVMCNIGISKVIIIVSESSIDIIKDILEKSPYNNICEFIIQYKPTGIGDAILLAKDKLSDCRFFILLGDEYYGDWESFSQIAKEKDNDLIIGTVQYKDVARIKSGCNIHFNGNKIIKLVEKPKEEEISGNWCWDGSLVLNSDIFPVLEELRSYNKQKNMEGACLITAIQKLIDNNVKITAFRRVTANINMTNESDFILAGLLEYRKNYGQKSIDTLLNQMNYV